MLDDAQDPTSPPRDRNDRLIDVAMALTAKRMMEEYKQHRKREDMLSKKIGETFDDAAYMELIRRATQRLIMDEFEVSGLDDHAIEAAIIIEAERIERRDKRGGSRSL